MGKMKQMKMAAALALLFLTVFVQAEVVDFTTRYAPENPARMTTVSTQLSIDPSVAVQGGRTTICTNSQVTLAPSINAQSWYSSSFEAVTPSYAQSAGELLGPFATQGGHSSNRNNPIRWVTAANYQTLFTNGANFLWSPTMWTNFWTPIGGPQAVQENIHYWLHGGTSTDYITDPNSPHGTYAPALMGIYCKGPVSLISPSNPSYNQILSSDYLGGTLSTPTLTMPASPGTVTFLTRADVTGCSASEYDQLVDSTQDSGHIFDDNSFSYQFNGNTVSINVENPYSCPSLSASSSIPQQCTSTPFTFSFTITNPSSKAIEIYDARLPTGSQFSDLGGMPPSIIVPAFGSATVSTAHAIAPPTSGTHALQIEFRFRTTTADCTGNQIDCGWQNVLIANVDVVQCGTMTCAVSNPLPSDCMNRGDSRPFNISCYLNEEPANCPPLHWTTTIDGGSAMFPQDTAGGIPAPQSALLVSNSATIPQDGFVNAIASDGSGMVCTGAAACIRAGTATTCTVADVTGGSISPGDTHNFNASCFDGAGRTTLCPQFFWSTSGLTGSRIIPSTITPPGIVPQRTLAFHPTAPAPQNGSINVTDGASLRCGARVEVSLPSPPPMSCSISGSAIIDPGASEIYTATCWDEGFVVDCIGLHWTTTLPDGTMNPIYTPQAPPTPQSTLSLPASAPVQSGQVLATNESYFPVFSCIAAVVSTPVPILQPDLIVNLSSNALNNTLVYGNSVRLIATTRNIGTLSTQNASVTRLFKNGVQWDDFTITDLAPNSQRLSARIYICQEGEPAVAVFNATADATSTVYESNENNNEAVPGLVFTCGPGADFPDSCELDPGATPIGMGGTQRFNITCFTNVSGVPAETYCPIINWWSDCGPISFDENIDHAYVTRTNVVCTNVTASALDFNCSAIIADLPDIVTIIDVDDFTPNIGDSAMVKISECNIGFLPAGPNTLNVTVAGALMQHPVGTLTAGMCFAADPFEVPCSIPGFITVRSYGDALQNVTEANERNNGAVATINCGAVLACPDYI
jgi:hypothetical protein